VTDQPGLGGIATIHNALIAGLPASDRLLLSPLLHAAVFGSGQKLLSTEAAEECLFIDSGLVSLRCEPDGLSAVEVGLIGPEGMLGLAAVLGDGTRTHTASALTRCETWAIAAADLQWAFERSPAIRGALLRYANARLGHVMKRSACHLQHRLEQRLAGWILQATARLSTARIAITHKQLADLLGATRSGVTLAIQDLEGEQAIRAQRNLITVRSRPTLAGFSCGCFSDAHRHEAALPAMLLTGAPASAH
jgi:CRP-like cAMP-binding protein